MLKLLGAILLLSAALVTSNPTKRARRSIDLKDALSHMNDFYLPRAVIPNSYRLKLIPNVDEGQFKGHVWINVTCMEATDTIVLHAHEDLNISQSTISVKQISADGEARVSEAVMKIKNTSPSIRELSVSGTKKEIAKQWYIIMLAESLKKNTMYEVQLNFLGQLNDEHNEGFFRGYYVDSKTQQKKWYAGTQMRSTNARRVFPCFDEPALKATFDISVGAKRKYHVWSNMPIKDTEEMPEDTAWLWHHFQTTPVMSTFSAGVFVSDFHYATFTGDSFQEGYLRVSARPEFLGQLEASEKVLSESLTFMQNILDVPYPLMKLDLVAIPDNQTYFPDDLWGLLIYKESDLTGEGSLWYIARDVAAQWIGHLTTTYWWSDSLINVAITEYLAQEFVKQRLNTYSPLEHALLYAFSKPEPYSNKAVQRESSDVSRVCWLLKMLNFTLSDETFKRGMHRFLDDRKYKTFHYEDLWDSLTIQGRNDETLPEDIRVSDIAKSWISKERYPFITVTRDYEKNTAQVKQQIFLRERPHDISGRDMVWYIPLMYITPDNLNASVPRPKAWMKNQKEVTVQNLPDKDQFVIFNPEETENYSKKYAPFFNLSHPKTGMFLVNYDEKNWELITQYLKDSLQGKKPNVPAATRGKVLHDAWNLAFGGELSFATALNVSEFLKYETDDYAWDRMLTMFDHVGRYMDGISVGKKFKDFMIQLMNEAIINLDKSKPSEALLITKLQHQSESINPPIYNEQEQALYKDWIETQDPHKICDYTSGPPKGMAPICQAFKQGTMEEYEAGLQHTINMMKKVPGGECQIVVKYLIGCPRQPEKIERLLNAIFIEGNPAFTDRSIEITIIQSTSNYVGWFTLFRFLENNWDIVKSRLENKPDLWTAMVWDSVIRLITREDYDMALELYTAHKGQFGVAEPTIENALKKIKAESEWTEVVLPIMEQWLDKHLGYHEKSDETTEKQ
uniref:Aminopeptidase n=1 Tax=Timema poppense TaxID=170557 RepID=A0A7R9CQI6_TIMPO|nr:unnamed protein product [Timema poppensis]